MYVSCRASAERLISSCLTTAGRKSVNSRGAVRRCTFHCDSTRSERKRLRSRQVKRNTAGVRGKTCCEIDERALGRVDVFANGVRAAVPKRIVVYRRLKIDNYGRTVHLPLCITRAVRMTQTRKLCRRAKRRGVLMIFFVFTVRKKKSVKKNPCLAENVSEKFLRGALWIL